MPLNFKKTNKIKWQHFKKNHKQTDIANTKLSICVIQIGDSSNFYLKNYKCLQMAADKNVS